VIVETLGDDIGQAVIDDDLDFDVRVLLEEFGKFRPADGVGRMLGGRDANGARGFFAKLT
jgi:hypothetical protein